MNINLICPICKKERKFNNWWQLVFGEERATFKEQIDSIIKNDWLKELPKIQEEIKTLEKERVKLEEQIDIKIRVKLKFIGQKLVFLYERMKYNNQRG